MTGNGYQSSPDAGKLFSSRSNPEIADLLRRHLNQPPDINELIRECGLDFEACDYICDIERLIAIADNEGTSEALLHWYLQSLGQNEGDFRHYILLGLILQSISNHDAARLAFENVSLLRPSSVDSLYFELVSVDADQVKIKAEAGLKTLQIDQTINQSVLYRILRQYIAVASAKEALDLEAAVLAPLVEPDVKIANHLGNLFFRLQRYQDAAVCYQQALDQDPEYTDARTNLNLVRHILNSDKKPFCIVLPRGENYGWGVCSHNLRKQLSSKLDVISLEYDDWTENGNKEIPGTVFSAIGAENLELLYPVRGEINVGYTFFERSLTHEAKENAKFFDLVLAGSSWAADQLRQHGIEHCDVLVQGIDNQLFYPVESDQHNGFFVFSGGKLELRKGQDLVLKAISVLQQRYQDIILVNAWVNFWPQSMATMAFSPYITYENRGGDWSEIMSNLYRLNNIDEARVITCDIVPHHELRDLYARTDLGVFPNRSEGGTNLVMMEYMACGKPVIAADCTGHQDIINETNSLLLSCPKKNEYIDAGGQHYATWDEPDLEQLIEQIDYAYQHRDEIAVLGRKAGEDLAQFTWSDMADNLIAILKKWQML